MASGCRMEEFSHWRSSHASFRPPPPPLVHTYKLSLPLPSISTQTALIIQSIHLLLFPSPCTFLLLPPPPLPSPLASSYHDDPPADGRKGRSSSRERRCIPQEKRPLSGVKIQMHGLFSPPTSLPEAQYLSSGSGQAAEDPVVPLVDLNPEDPSLNRRYRVGFRGSSRSRVQLIH
ncbi:hypothetical protein PBY51_013844 [Eleginops maclovinus]|uniref:Uncharacterized protein n=1 Tax=Eleginops maclovinus TaxID=56733 RepID=A0AAN7Y019_ELEMC|nr:hypothetical protein PBY51_013844 [Eleginops maclovinus]